MTALRKWTRQEVALMTGAQDVAIIIDNVVYGVSSFLEDHPGGEQALRDNAGKDASQCFYDVGHGDHAIELRQNFVIGEVVDEDKWEVPSRSRGAPEPSSEPLTVGALLSVWGPPLVMGGLSAALYMYLFPQ